MTASDAQNGNANNVAHGTGADSALNSAAAQQLAAALGPDIRLAHELGSGGMARVFAARDTRLGRDVAVKLLRPDLAAALSTERFSREVRVAASLQAPHVVPVLSAGETADGLPYYIMPLIRGESLRARLNRNGALPPTDAMGVLRDIARALAAAHTQGIVHRDIKPENVLLTETAGGTTAMVTDFGIAKAFNISIRRALGDETKTALDLARALTSDGMALGTPAYMAPEQVSGESSIDPRADLYAWGLVAFEVLTGRHPFAERTTAQSLLVAQLVEMPVSLGDLMPNLPGHLVDVVMRCLAKTADQRPRDIREVLSVFDVAAAGAQAGVWRAGTAKRSVTARTFALSDAVLRQLDRSVLDPRLPGSGMHYLENDGPTRVLVFCIHGLWHEAEEWSELLATTPHRVIAPTLMGFETSPAESARAGGRTGAARVALALDAHVGLLRALLLDAIGRVAPERVILVGFSSGADVALRMLASGALARSDSHASDRPVPQSLVHGCLLLGPNLSLATCFASRIFSRLAAGPLDSAALVHALQAMGAGAADMDEWLNIMTYQLHSYRKFRDDIAPLRRFSSDIVRPFESAAPVGTTERVDAGGVSVDARGLEVFADWYRLADMQVNALRCVFDQSALCVELVQALRLRNLDAGVLGPTHRSENIVVDTVAHHFALIEPARVLRHIDQLNATLDSGG
jgi:serine/threonine protein kinase